MTGSFLYLDNAATTPMRPSVAEAMRPYETAFFGNPSSLHAAGRVAKKALQTSMAQIGDAVGAASADDIIITSGGTESDNLAIQGTARGSAVKGRHIITTQIEHPAVLEPCRYLESQGWEIDYLGVDEAGFVRPDDLKTALRPDTVLVSILHGNNEVGTVQDLATLGAIAQAAGALFHTDAVQTVGKLEMDCRNLPIDLLSGSGHKVYGPKGVGFLYANAKARSVLHPQVHGGGQQQNLRSGTHNVFGTVGLAQALRDMQAERDRDNNRLYRLMAQLISGINHLAPDAPLNGPRDVYARVPGNVNFSFPPVGGEAMVLRLDLMNVGVSSGSACHSGGLNPSHVVMAMTGDIARASGTVRFSLGRHTTVEDVDRVLDILPAVLQKTGYQAIPSPVSAGQV